VIINIFSARIWEQYGHEQNTLCNMYVMKIYLFIYFCLVPSQRTVLENNTSIGMVMTVSSVSSGRILTKSDIKITPLGTTGDLYF
jgi:uncharacterized membrane protein